MCIAELAAIDGVLDPVAGLTAVVECTVVTNTEGTTNQVMEGYDFGIGLPTVEAVLWANVDPNVPAVHNGCFFRVGLADPINFALEQADAQNCQAEILAHCTKLGQ